MNISLKAYLSWCKVGESINHPEKLLKALSHHDVWPERMPSYAKYRKYVGVRWCTLIYVRGKLGVRRLR